MMPFVKENISFELVSKSLSLDYGIIRKHHRRTKLT